MSKPSPLEQAGLRILRLHDTIYQESNGWIGHRLPGVPPTLLLHTVGAKTGQPRTTSLTYAQTPGLRNQHRSKRFAVTARRVTPDDSDYNRMWQLVNNNNANRYNGYQSKTSRPIPIFVLTKQNR